MKLRVSPIILAAALAVACPAFAQDDLARLLRMPDVSADRIAFVYGGDIWTVEIDGGVARRLTSDVGAELFPKLSPDGTRIAFSAEYGGNRQVWVMPVDGGTPRQLTFYNSAPVQPLRGGWDCRVMDWTPDGKSILVRLSRTPWGSRMGRPYLVPVDGGMEKPLAVPESGGATFSPDGTKLVYTPIEREFRNWKRYRGGRAQDVWIYDLVKNTADRITDDPGTDNEPVWVGDMVYFTSDRKGMLNLWSWNPATRETRQVTEHRDFDVLWPSAGRSSIVYEAGGFIYRFVPATGKSVRIPIRLFGDLRPTPSIRNVRGEIESISISPTGARALISARGDIFTVPAKDGEIRNITRSDGVREFAPTWSPDGSRVAYLSDRTGEYEIRIRNQDGSGDEKSVTTGADTWRFPPVWSPDGRFLAFGDKKQRLRYVEIATGKVTDVDRSNHNDITTYRWSPDSRWIAYTRVGANQMNAIWVHSLADGKNVQLTSGFTNDTQPVFDPKGRYLYFLSNRDFNPTFSGFEFNFVYTNPARVYVGILASNGPALFLPASDEERSNGSSEQAENSVESKKTKSEQAVAAVRIDAPGFELRVRAIPGAPAEYRELAANTRGVLYLSGAEGDSKLKFYDIDKKKEEIIIEGISDFDLSSDGEKLVYRRGEEYGIAAVALGQKTGEGLLALESLEMKIDPSSEWKQIFADAWRMTRDWFYDPGMNGVDWLAVRKKYEPLVAHASTRADLDYILHEMGGELETSHAYISSPKSASIPRMNSGLLGAEIEQDPSGYVRVGHIFPGENWNEYHRSPLTEPGVDVNEGDFILAVDGRSTRDVKNFYELLEKKANRVVTLRVGSRPELAGSREEKVRPVAHELSIRYLDWVRSRTEYVDRVSGGRIGYIHMPNTATEGNRELFRYFYPQAGKDALIIDDRYNGGGFIPDRMIELLDRPILNYWVRRGIEPDSTPGFANDGPKAVLINGLSSSGGDAFAYYFRKRGLGVLIGTRTWGGLVGIEDETNPKFVDGGAIYVPSFRFLDTEGKWAVEGIGVEPDIEVIDRPDLVAKGQDPSLEKAVEVLLEQLKKNPPRKITVPPVTHR